MGRPFSFHLGPERLTLKRRRPESFGALVARTHGAGQPAVVAAILIVPEWVAHADTIREDVELLLRTRWRLGGAKVIVDAGCEVLIVTILEDGLEYVFQFGIGHVTCTFLNSPKKIVYW